MNEPLPKNKVGLLAELVRSARLCWRLLADPRVSTVTKLVVPALMGLYMLFPADFLPDIIPLAGQLDDLAVLMLGIKLFIDLCPPEVVQEHRADLAAGRPPRRAEPQSGDIVEGEFRVIE